MTQGAFGLALQIDVTDTPATFAKILDVDPISFMNYIVEATTHDSASGYYEAIATGKKRVEPLSVTLAWDSSQASHAAVVTAFDAGTATTFTFADPDGDETISVEIIVERMARGGTQDGLFTCKVDLHPTGAPTIA